MSGRPDVSFAALQNGESVGLSVIEIVSIPDSMILRPDRAEPIDIERANKDAIVGMLSELCQVFAMYQRGGSFPLDVSVELVWTTRPAVNQPYLADISMHMVLRAVHMDRSYLAEVIQAMVRISRATLTLQKYEHRVAPAQDIIDRIASVPNQDVRAIVKAEWIENLQNQFLSACYAYDILPDVAQDLRRVVSVLTLHPGAALSIQLMPTAYTSEELNEIGNMAQTLSALHAGVLGPGSGVAAAEKFAKLYRYYADIRDSALMQYNILVFGDALATSEIASSLYGLFNTTDDAKTHLKILKLPPASVAKDTNFYPMPWAVHEIIQLQDRLDFFRSMQGTPSYFRLPFLLSAMEAAEILRLPIGNEAISAGLPISQAGQRKRTYAGNIINGGDLSIGKLRSSPKDTIGLFINDLTRHMFVAGTPGSGKTTFSIGLLDRLWKEHGIPFLVIEPAKNEYRALVRSIPDLQVFTPGKYNISPFLMNPFVPPHGVTLEAYKYILKTAFAAAVSMTPPLDRIFDEALDNCYSDHGWLETYTIADGGRIFNIADYVKSFSETFEAIGYSGDAKNIGRAGLVRLSGMSRLFDAYHTIPVQDILQKPTLVELSAIENDEQKALIIALLLLSILSYVNSNYLGDGKLRNVILLEEAHVLLGMDTQAMQGEANPSVIAQGLIKRMLAEIRSYGVGMIIADQSPRKVTADVIALTDIKMAFRLIETEDKRMMADSTSMDEASQARLSKLKTGEAFFFFNRLEEPEEILLNDYRRDNRIDITLSDETIRDLSAYWRDKQTLLRPYPQCGETCYCTDGCQHDLRVLARETARRIFVKYFKAEMRDLAPVLAVFSEITAKAEAALGSVALTPQLRACVKVHLWRRILYGTQIPVTTEQIHNSLKKP